MLGVAASSSDPPYTEEEVASFVAMCDDALNNAQTVYDLSSQQQERAEELIATLTQMRQRLLSNQVATPEALSAINDATHSISTGMYVTAPVEPLASSPCTADLNPHLASLALFPQVTHCL